MAETPYRIQPRQPEGAPLIVEPWRQGDVVAIDNHSMSHGRLPYEGPRRIAVCWA